MRKYVFTAFLACSLLMLSAAPVAFAAQGPVDDGAPSLDDNSPTGDYIWHDDKGFHLRTHGPHARHDFDAILHTNGVFKNVDPVRLEDGTNDRFEVRDAGHELVLHFETFDFTDGVNFNIQDGQRLRFNLKLDHTQIGTDHIFLGAHGAHPDSNPFVIRL